MFFTAPTAIRAIRKEDPEGEGVKGRDLSALKYLFLAGERTDVATYEWVSNLLQKPVIDHWWQTESGWPMLANMAGVGLIPIKPGSPTRPVFGFDIRILDAFGHEVANGEEGAVAIQLPLPPAAFQAFGMTMNDSSNRTFLITRVFIPQEMEATKMIRDIFLLPVG